MVERFCKIPQAFTLPANPETDMFLFIFVHFGDAADGLAGMKQGDLIIWYCEQQNAQGAYASTEEVKEEVKCIKAIIEV